jgi:hypothetical protein
MDGSDSKAADSAFCLISSSVRSLHHGKSGRIRLSRSWTTRAQAKLSSPAIVGLWSLSLQNDL